jgi:hypothetical protein
MMQALSDQWNNLTTIYSEGELTLSLDEEQESEKILWPPYEKLNKVCRDHNIYRMSEFPGMCWILEECLGIDPHTVRAESFDADTGFYETYLFTREGSRIYNEDGTARTLANMLTKNQMKMLREWWEFVPPYFKHGN